MRRRTSRRRCTCLGWPPFSKGIRARRWSCSAGRSGPIRTSRVASNDLGNLLAQQGMLAEAAASYRQAIAEAPDFAEAHNNLGNLLQMTGSLEEAVACYRTAVGLRPGYAEAFRNLGSALRRLGRPDEAVTALRAALAIDPGFAAAIAQLAHQLKELCDWGQLDDLTAQLIEIVEAGSAAVNPFVFLSLDTTPRQQLLCAKRWAAEQLGAAGETARGVRRRKTASRSATCRRTFRNTPPRT